MAIDDNTKNNWLGAFVDGATCISLRLPYLFEDFTGTNMNYYTAFGAPSNLLTSEMRGYIKEGNTNEVKKAIFKGLWEIDDPLDVYSKHTLLHDAVIMDRQEVFDFLLQQGANLMVRD